MSIIIIRLDSFQKAFDPRNRIHIGHAIKDLFDKVDTSPKDQRLSLDEVLKHADVFIDTRILDPERALHEDM